jgi:hypothetical protein
MSGHGAMRLARGRQFKNAPQAVRSAEALFAARGTQNKQRYSPVLLVKILVQRRCLFFTMPAWFAGHAGSFAPYDE